MPSIIPGIENIDWAGITANLMYWLGYGLLIILVMGFLIVLFMLSSYNIKVKEYKLYGSGKDGVYAFAKPKNNRVKWVAKRTAWKSLFPLFNKNKREPFDQEYIYPGNNVIAFNFNGEWVPGRININRDEKTLRAEINPVPYYVRNWQSLKYKEHAQEFAEHNFWEDNKYFFMVIITAAICLVMVGLTVYFTYKYATSGLGTVSGLTNALQNFNTIGGIGPG